MTQTSKPAAGKFVFDRKKLTAGGVTAPKAPTCQLTVKRDCCGGKGYSLTTRGAQAHAALCKCVTECPACFGRARIVEGNNSKPCRTPPPNVVANLINAAMIPARYAEANLDKFSNNSGNALAVVDIVRTWLDAFTLKSKGLVISGPVGIGKTYILAAITKELAEKGLSVRFADFFQLIGELKAGFSENISDHAQLSPLVDVDVLIIDELGKGRNNDFEQTVLDQLVCRRYNQKKIIIASTNYGLGTAVDNRVSAARIGSSLKSKSGYSEDPSAGRVTNKFEAIEERITPRVWSRLCEISIGLNITGEDFRQPSNDNKR